MDSLNIGAFEPLRIEYQSLFDEYLTHFRSLFPCEYSFRDLFTWQASFPVSWTIYQSRLLIYESSEDYLLQPVGDYFSAYALREISESFIKKGLSGRISFVAQDCVENAIALEDYFKISVDEGMADYIYLTEKLAELKGKLSKKKNLVSQFRRNNPKYKCKMLDKHLIKDCKRLLGEWSLGKDLDSLTMRQEKTALDVCFKHFDDLNMEGLALFVDDKLLAFSIFSPHGKDTYIVHFEKCDLEVKGAYQTINWETARHLQKKCKYLNREQDLGLPGLRKAKKSYYPELLLKSYFLEPL
jgi:hypothetical protein